MANEKRLIDADDFIKHWNSEWRHLHPDDCFLVAIRNFHAVDAVEVVRCRDCKWWHEDDDVGHCDNPDGLDNYAKPDDFCSYGERKDDGSDG